jgi:hypothetical protein
VYTGNRQATLKYLLDEQCYTLAEINQVAQELGYGSVSDDTPVPDGQNEADQQPQSEPESEVNIISDAAISTDGGETSEFNSEDEDPFRDG